MGASGRKAKPSRSHEAEDPNLTENRKQTNQKSVFLTGTDEKVRRYRLKTSEVGDFLDLGRGKRRVPHKEHTISGARSEAFRGQGKKYETRIHTRRALLRTECLCPPNRYNEVLAPRAMPLQGGASGGGTQV